MILVAVVGLLIVVAVVGAMLASGGSDSSSSTAPSLVFDATATSASIAALPTATFDAVGAGTTTAGPKAVSLTPIVQGGKPELLYVGAEYCPFCAAERWAIVAALSRFGIFSSLTVTHSATKDVYPDTPTFSFYGATYSSKFLAFTAVETATNEPRGGSYKPLQKLTQEQNQILNETGETGIPLMDFGGKYVSSGATYDPGVLAERNGPGIAALMADPSTPISKAVLGAANGITAAICGMTENLPTAVCNSSGVQAARAALGL
jgi:hypothetical protein